MNVASLVSGIFFKTRINNAVEALGDNTFCSTVAEITATNPTIVIVDLEHPNAPEVIRYFNSKVLAFGPHLRYDLAAISKEFGIQAYPRSVFFNQLETLLRQSRTS